MAKKDDGLNDLERIERLERLLADLAEDVALGNSGHIRTAAQNKAMAVLRELRPAPVVQEAGVSGDVCGKLQDKDNDESAVCLKPRGHVGGHSYGSRPAA